MEILSQVGIVPFLSIPAAVILWAIIIAGIVIQSRQRSVSLTFHRDWVAIPHPNGKYAVIVEPLDDSVRIRFTGMKKAYIITGPDDDNGFEVKLKH